MEKKVVAVLIVLCLFLSLCACQPTPEDEYVVNRQNDAAIEESSAAVAASGSDTPTDEDAPSLPAYTFPAEWKEEFVSSGLGYTIRMEVQVDAFSLTEYPVYPLYSTNFTGEDVKNVLKALIGDVNLCVYERDKEGNNIPIKGTLDAEIEELTDQITNFDYYHKDDELTEAGKAYMIASMEEEMEEMQHLYKKAVDAEYTADYDSLCQLKTGHEGALFDKSNRYIGEFSVFHGDDGLSNGITISLRGNLTSAPYGEFQTPNTDVETGQKLCEDILSKLGLSDFVLNKITQKEGADQATYYFTRSCDGYPYSSAIYSTVLAGLDGRQLKYLYEPFWYDEFIMMIPGTYGLEFFQWKSKSTVGEPTRTVQLLPFEEIQKEFRKDIGYVTEYYEHKAGEERGIVVTDMQLGYKRVPVRDAYGSYELVPVWTFTGYYTSETMKYINSEELLILNAVDGSIVG